MLRDIGALFQRRTRPEDLVGRYGGDEFVMVVTGSPFYLVETVAARLVEEIGKLEWTVAPKRFSVGATIGLGSSHFLTDANLAKLLDVADRDLYKNKGEQRKPGVKPSVPSPAEDRVVPLPPRLEDRA